MGKESQSGSKTCKHSKARGYEDATRVITLLKNPQTPGHAFNKATSLLHHPSIHPTKQKKKGHSQVDPTHHQQSHARMLKMERTREPKSRKSSNLKRASY